MPLDAQSLALTKLLAQASTQHLRLTLEPLPVGSMEVTEHGIIESVDESTALKLGFALHQLQGKSITALLEDSESDFLQLLKNKQCGSLFQAAFRSESGEQIFADVILQPALQSHKFICSVIFITADACTEQRDHRVLDVHDEVDESLTQLNLAHNLRLLSVVFFLLIALVAAIIYYTCIGVTLSDFSNHPARINNENKQ